MVSRKGTSRGSASTRDRLLDAAAREFAARGFDGAKVDRIAAAARVNKAMLYYHFTNKAALYREILRALFGAAHRRVAAARDAGGPPEDQIRAFIEAIDETALAHPQFPAMWLREVAESGRHLDESVLSEMLGVMQVLAAIIAEGRGAGVFRDIPPLVVQLGIVGPLLIFRATGPMRQRVQADTRLGLATVPREAMLAHVQAITLAALRDDEAVGQTVRTSRVRPSSKSAASASKSKRSSSRRTR